MTAQDNKDEKQAAPSNPQDLATVRTFKQGKKMRARQALTQDAGIPWNHQVHNTYKCSFPIILIRTGTPIFPHACSSRNRRTGTTKLANQEPQRGEQTAAQLEANLTNLESKLDAMLAAFEEQEAPGTATTTTAAADVNGKNSSGGGKDA